MSGPGLGRFDPPAGYSRIRVVASFEALVAVPFRDGCNAVCWPRALPGDFDEVVRHLAPGEGLTTLAAARLRALPVGSAGRAAIDTLLGDQQLLRSIGHAPVLECVRSYERDSGPVPTDVYSFHVDRATAPTDTYLCTYTGPPSEGLRNDEARRCIDVPTVRAQLLAQFGGRDGPEFAAHLTENCLDLHYRALPTARPFSFGTGNLWRLAVEHPGSVVPACIHRAPAPDAGHTPRLLLIS
ncbi:MAG: hypothetical protein JNM25_19425 [Planctomycetes bacterium]|nr:hypothetical protein [Planctomycetota bacterium]